MGEFAVVALRTVITFIVLLVVTRLLGRKQISQLTFFNYIAGITIGSMAASFTVESHVSAVEGATGVIGWCVLTLLVEIVSLKWPRARVALDGQPVILISQGKIAEHELFKTRMNMDDLSMMLRDKNVFSIQEVEYAILEPKGSLTVLLKDEFQNVRKSDLLYLPATPIRHLPTELIADGKLIEKNLLALHLTEEWLNQELRKRRVLRSEVFYAEMQADGSLYVDLYDRLKH